MTQDEYIRQHWPKDVPEDCTRRTLARPEDCYHAGPRRRLPCESCKTYDRLVEQYHLWLEQNA